MTDTTNDEKKIVLENLEFRKKSDQKEFELLRDYILRKEKDRIVVIHTFDGLYEAKLDEIIKQPTEGLLYDLNRDKATVLTYIDQPKWVNDYAVGLVISKLKSLLSQQGEFYDKHKDAQKDVRKEIQEYFDLQDR